MKPNFALNLSFDGISLLIRAKGGWRVVGDVDVDDPDLTEKLRFLRRTATEMAGGQFATKLVVPNSQILFRDVMADGDTPGARRIAIRKALDGTTPYALDDLVFDWSDAGNGLAKVAVVAAVTLQEAEDFAVEHRFNPVSFVANPDQSDFKGEPWFGTTRQAKGLLPTGENVERDDQPLTIIGPAQVATPSPDTAADLETVAEQAEDIFDETAQAPKVAPPPQILTLRPVAENAVNAGAGPQVDQSRPLAPPHLETAMAAMAFSSRRPNTDAGFAETTPLRLEKMTPRIAIRADKIAVEDHDALPRLGGANRTAEVTHLSVTAPQTADDEREEKLVPPSAPAPRFALNGKAPVSAHFGLDTPPAKATPADGTAATTSARQDVTVFGARKLVQVRGKPRYLGLVLTLALILALAAAAFLSTLILGDDSVVSRLFRPAGPTIEAATSQIDSIDISAPVDEEMQLDLTPLDPTATEFPVDDESATDATAPGPLWANAPTAPIGTDPDSIDDLYVASIDPVVVSHDAVALPSKDLALTDAALAARQSPTAAGTVFDIDENGHVRAVPEGALTPDGVMVFAGKPALVPLPRAAGTTVVEGVVADALAAFRPRARPGNLVEENQKSRLGGRTLAQLAALRPTPRPESAQETGNAVEAPPTKLAVLASPAPASRPSDFSRVVEKALAEAQAAEPQPVAPAAAAPSERTTVVAAAAVAAPKLPAVPTRASVAKEATVKNAIDLGKINLIGVYGSSSNRRALIRLSSGKYVKVQVGDRVDGGQVAAIGSSEVLYVKGGRRVTLAMPKS